MAFADSTNAKRHEKTHYGERLFSCNIPFCGRTYSRGHSLKNHMMTIHSLTQDDTRLLAAIRPLTIGAHFKTGGDGDGGDGDSEGKARAMANEVVGEEVEGEEEEEEEAEVEDEEESRQRQPEE